MDSQNTKTSRNDFSGLYPKEYFQTLYQENAANAVYLKRIKMYPQEYARIRTFVDGGAVLDVGCGMGDFMALFPRERWAKYGIDVSDYALQAASSKGVQIELPENPREHFDLIVFRGSLQHLDEPFVTLKKCITWLKPGGYMVFLATPNTGSICYRLFQELPMLDPPRNFALFSAKTLKQALENLGLEVVEFRFPYRNTPYARPLYDISSFILRLFGIRKHFSFWGSMMECYARKPLPATPTAAVR